MTTATCLLTLTGHVDLVRSIYLSPYYIISGGYDESIKIWSRSQLPSSSPSPIPAKTGEGGNCIEINGKGGRVFRVVGNEEKIVWCGQEGKVVIWDFTNGCTNPGEESWFV